MGSGKGGQICLRQLANELQRQFVLVSLLYQIRTYFQNRWCALKLNRTLDENPTHWRVRQQPRKKKHSLHFCFGGGGFFLKKGKGVFLSGFCPPSIRAGGGASMRTKFWQNYFLGRKGFAKTSAHLFLNLDVANGKGGMRTGFGFLFWKNWRL